VQDIAGGALVTGPGAEDLENPETARYYDRFYAGAGVGGRERLMALALVRNLVASDYGAYQEVLAVHAEGSLEAEKQMVLRSYDPSGAVALVKKLTAGSEPAVVASPVA
jgi:aromatic ring hydroxylase